MRILPLVLGGLVLCTSLVTGQVRAVAPTLPILVTSSDGLTADGGRAVDLVREAARRAGVPVTFEVEPWVRALGMVQKTPNVLLFPVARTPDREGLFDWIGPVNRVEYWFFRLANGPAPVLTGLDGLGSRTVGVLKNDAVSAYLRTRVPRDQIQEISEYSSLPPMFLAGRFDYLAAVPSSLYGALADLGKPRTVVQALFAVPQLSSDPYSYVVVQKGSDPALVAGLHQALDAMVKDGTWETMFRKYQ
jgi:polar amino acid transport system substrate-binding protein